MSEPCPGVCRTGGTPIIRVIARPENKFLDTPANTEELATFVDQKDIIPVVGGVFIDYELGPIFIMASSATKQALCSGPCATAGGGPAPLSRVVELPENKFLDTVADVDGLKAMVRAQKDIIPVVGGIFIDYELGPIYIMASSTMKPCGGTCAPK
ncbi:unnamed protein product [Acanthoscelides obtectus]|uniref:Uncharacterized protein n=1 Tax=Acanthoscelides obtectus TaxID=200917 RepID=A0A9P0PXW9_ACAOB|nr:unnamed protein product [Acanthoscelides obtectus]CAK1675429.1 hypothetical protein AOBTE_LOCUS30215 [Acanthoscelides obtectus]